MSNVFIAPNSEQKKDACQLSNCLSLTIALFTYNSSKIIEETLEMIHCADRTSWDSVELFVIDNNSIDNTRDIVTKFIEKVDYCKLIVNTKQGLIFSREKAVQECNTTYLTFVDDDNHVAKGFFVNLREEILKYDKPDAIGSTSTERVEFVPDWWIQHRTSFACGSPGGNFGNITHTDSNLWGACLTLKTDMAKRVFGYPPFICTGRVGNGLIASGEDTELCYRVRMGGGKLVLSNNLKFCHVINRARLSSDYLDKLLLSFAVSQVLLEPYKAIVANKNGLIYMSVGIVKNCVRLLSFNNIDESIFTQRQWLKILVLRLNTLFVRYRYYKKLI